MNSVTLQRDIEVDQKAQIPTTREQVGKKLRVMKRRQAIDGLKLYHHRLGNNQVHAMATIQSEAFCKSPEAAAHRRTAVLES